MIWFMFGGQPYRLMRTQLAEILGVDLVDVSLHTIKHRITRGFNTTGGDIENTVCARV
jgi:hypothetical protein